MDVLTNLQVEPKLAPLKYRASAALIDFLILWLLSFGMGYFRLTGRTIGKRIVQIKVVKEDYSDIAAATPKKQRIGDLVAKTVVVIG